MLHTMQIYIEFLRVNFRLNSHLPEFQVSVSDGERHEVANLVNVLLANVQKNSIRSPTFEIDFYEYFALAMSKGLQLNE